MGSRVSRHRASSGDIARTWLHVLSADVVGEIDKYMQVRDRVVVAYVRGTLRCGAVSSEIAEWCNGFVTARTIDYARSPMIDARGDRFDQLSALCAHWDAVGRLRCRGACGYGERTGYRGTDCPCMCSAWLPPGYWPRKACEPGKCMFMYEYVGDLVIGRPQLQRPQVCD